MKLVTYNIRYGIGIDDQLDLPRIAAELKSADIIGLQEVDRFWQRNGEIDQAEELARLLSDYHWVFGPGLDMDASYRDASGMLVNRRRQHGEMILSRYPIISTRTFPLPKIGSISRHAIQAALLEAIVDAPGGPLRIYNVHLFYWSPDFALKQARFVFERILTAPDEGGAWSGDPEIIDDHWINGDQMPPMPTDAVLLGDMNNGAGTPVYEVFVGSPSMEGGRVHTLNAFVDPWVWMGNDESSGKTAHFDTRRIDHIFVGAGLRARIQKMWINDEAQGSDHLPVWLELSDVA